ncbi:ADP-ribosylhydrolase ARH1-like [Mercenaria mercenaria]|uniref:ADP-ribosylhydrolase ARH1-like n=1 Tax=Mercenaria mercenaria TaxID=6596 RepID=UPI00234FAC2C|nr:ADP-ribosylhydrolase ARH1-like [Mercenaria mercenaria]
MLRKGHFLFRSKVEKIMEQAKSNKTVRKYWSVQTGREQYVAGMLLSSVGDALGYKNGKWEFCQSGERIHQELKELGGVKNIHVCLPEWIVSDDTVMHLATADALIRNKNCLTKGNLYSLLAEEYKICMNDMEDRAPGVTCEEMVEKLRPLEEGGYRIPFNPKGGGCGAAMRSMCIGLRYPRFADIEDLIEVSVESGRMTHHHPTGYLGSLASALFTSYAVRKKPVREWGAGLLECLELAKTYVMSCKGIYVDENIKSWGYFENKWKGYLRLRNILDGKNEPSFPADFDKVMKRDQFYTMMSYDNWGGASGHDAPMIAYDAILACSGDWSELCDRAMFHGGDSDSTGAIAGCLFGVLYGLDNVPKCNYKHVEYRERIEKVADELYDLAMTK